MQKTETNITEKSNFTARRMAMTAVITAVTCILAPLSIPIGPIPISLTNLVIYFGLYVLGRKNGCISYLIYLLIGLVGLPVFSGFTGGPGKLFGPTGGYLIGFIAMAFLAGTVIDRFYSKWYLCLLGMILGTVVCYGFGSAWLAYQAGIPFRAALLTGVLPFIPGDLIKMILALIIGPKLRKQLQCAGLLHEQ